MLNNFRFVERIILNPKKLIDQINKWEPVIVLAIEQIRGLS
mgnify:CR=1 FL=1